MTAKHYRQTGKKPEPDLVELVWLVCDSEEHFVRDDLKCRFLSHGSCSAFIARAL